PYLVTTKSVSPELKLGQVSTYTIIVTNTGPLTTPLPALTVDEIDPTLVIGTVSSPCTVSGQTVTCVTPAGLTVGSTVTYTIDVTPTVVNLSGIINVARTSGGGDPSCPVGSTDPTCLGISGPDPVNGGARLTTTKSVTPMTVGQVAVYTITVANHGTSPTTDITTTVDNVDATLIINSVQATSGGGSCSVAGQRVVCTTPIGLAVGASAVYEISVTPTRASSTGIINVAQTEGGGDTDCPAGNTSTACQGISGPDQIQHADVGTLRVVKQAAVREANIGDLVRYTLVVTNVGTLDVTNYMIIDTPPQGFSYVNGSATVSTGDTLTISGNGPIQFGGLNLRVGQEAQIVYLVRVGAGVRPGRHINTAEAYAWAGDSEPTSISNRATAEVTIMANDPMLDESLLLGTVYHDRNGNGVQDEGEEGLPGVRIATVEGLLIETDQYGRYHLEGILGGEWSRGRNFIMKVDPATLPRGARFTTDNPLIRRITPGLPVRFDFGVQFDGAEGGAPAASEAKEMEIDEAMFVPGRADIRSEHLPMIGQIAEQIREQRISEIVIVTVAEGSLMEARATALREALSQQLGARRAASLGVSARKPGALGGAGVRSSGGTTSPISGTSR
ncbi:MAG: DUF11 domain-containing protein, partial [Xanthomonadaceae bacterium]|nr:DUF11 domain-containing protein [Xanthomonadaceae bacterium]